MVKNGEEITIQEIAKILKISKEEVAVAIDSGRPIESIYQEESNDDNGRYLIDKISNSKDEANMITNKITIQEMIKSLTPREKEVILLRFYKDKTQAQVGKILGISQVQVSRIEKRVLEQMKSKLEAV